MRERHLERLTWSSWKTLSHLPPLIVLNHFQFLPDSTKGRNVLVQSCLGKKSVSEDDQGTILGRFQKASVQYWKSSTQFSCMSELIAPSAALLTSTVECMPRVRMCSMPLICINLFNPHNKPMKRSLVSSFHLTDEDIKVQN